MNITLAMMIVNTSTMHIIIIFPSRVFQLSEYISNTNNKNIQKAIIGLFLSRDTDNLKDTAAN